MLLSGDAAGPVADVANRLGITRWKASLSPEGKVAELDRLKGRRRRVLMVGDGLNDTAALARRMFQSRPHPRSMPRAQHRTSC